MTFDLATKEDLSNFKHEIIAEISSLFNEKSVTKKWLKSADVRKLLNISPGTLQNLRVNGTLPFTRMGATIFYDYTEVDNILKNNKR